MTSRDGTRSGRRPNSAQSIGVLIRKLRKQKRMTLEKLSEETGISVSSLSRIENTQLGMNLDKVRAIAAALGVPVETLVSHSPMNVAPAAAQTQSDSYDSSIIHFNIDRARGRRISRVVDEAAMHYMFGKESGRMLDSVYFRVEPISVWDSEFVRHPGEKVIYLLSGDLVAYYEGQSPLLLEAGDSLYLSGNRWHSLVGANGKTADLLAIYFHGSNPGAGTFETRRYTAKQWAALNS